MRYVNQLTDEELKSLLLIFTEVPEEGFKSIEIKRFANEIELYGLVDWERDNGMRHTITGKTYYLTDFHLGELFGIDVPEDKFLAFMQERFGFEYTLSRINHNRGEIYFWLIVIVIGILLCVDLVELVLWILGNSSQ